MPTLSARRTQQGLRRFDLWQTGVGVRLRRCGQGLRGRHEEPERNRLRGGSGPYLRAASLHGGLPCGETGHHRVINRHFRDRDRQQGHHHGQPHVKNEEQRNHLQHRPLRQ